MLHSILYSLLLNVQFGHICDTCDVLDPVTLLTIDCKQYEYCVTTALATHTVVYYALLHCTMQTASANIPVYTCISVTHFIAPVTSVTSAVSRLAVCSIYLDCRHCIYHICRMTCYCQYRSILYTSKHPYSCALIRRMASMQCIRKYVAAASDNS
jgi:hypothetical protein